MEAAAGLAKEMKESDVAVQMYLKAAQYHKETGSGERTGQSYILAAK